MSVGNDEGRAAPRSKRRSWSTDEKRRIVDESLEDGASIAEIARRHDLNANQLFTWRRQFGVEPKELAPILPVMIASDVATDEADPRSTGQMEILLAEGERIIVWSDVETAALTRVLKALARR